MPSSSSSSSSVALLNSPLSNEIDEDTDTTSCSYHASIIQDLLTQDGLVILGRGLGVDQVIRPLIKLHANPHRVVFILNLTNKEKEAFQDNDHGMPLKVITSEFTSEKRQQMYLAGGCFSVTARILTVDLLNKLISIDLIAGFIINHAHRVNESSPEAFILRIFRQVNKSGFIYAFSDHPDAFARGGHSKAEQIMRHLFLTKLYLWPRFRLEVKTCFESTQPQVSLVKPNMFVCMYVYSFIPPSHFSRHFSDLILFDLLLQVIEIQQPLTPLMKRLQHALISVIHACAMELKSSGKVVQQHLEVKLSVNTCLSRAFDITIRNQLLGVWDRVPSKARKLIQDLSTLRKSVETSFSFFFSCLNPP